MRRRWLYSLAGVLAVSGCVSVLAGCGGGGSETKSEAATVRSPEDQARYNEDMAKRSRPPSGAPTGGAPGAPPGPGAGPAAPR